MFLVQIIRLRIMWHRRLV